MNTRKEAKGFRMLEKRKVTIIYKKLNQQKIFEMYNKCICLNNQLYACYFYVLISIDDETQEFREKILCFEY